MNVVSEIHAVNLGIVIGGVQHRCGFVGNFLFQINNFDAVIRIPINFGDGHAVMERIYPAGRIVNGNLNDGMGSAVINGMAFNIFQHPFHQAGTPVGGVNQNSFIKNQIFVFDFRLKFGHVSGFTVERQAVDGLGNQSVAVKDAQHV